MSAVTPVTGGDSPMAGADCGHTRRQHCTCLACAAACATRQAEDDLIPILWPMARGG